MKHGFELLLHYFHGGVIFAFVESVSHFVFVKESSEFLQSDSGWTTFWESGVATVLFSMRWGIADMNHVSQSGVLWIFVPGKLCD